NGTRTFASERVPASSGPPVPTPLPFRPELPKIAFSAPAEKPKSVPAKEPAASSITKFEATPAPKKDETPITLSLKAVLQNLPAFQVGGDVSTVPDDERITLSLKLIESQLPSGRVSIPA